MIRVEKILFPGIVAGCLFLVMVTSLISKPAEIVRASVNAGAQPAANAIAQALPIVPLASGEEAPADGGAEQQAGTLVEEQPPATEETPPDVPVIHVEMPVEEAVSTPTDAEMRAGGSVTCAVSSAYPDSILQWCASITAAAQQHGLDPNLIAAVMLQESGGQADAYSKSGAVGLMQVMPRDGLAAGFMCINGPCFSARPSMDELFNPDYNIAYGVRMLAGLIQKHGSERDALRAYGPMNMGYYYADLVLSIYNRYR